MILPLSLPVVASLARGRPFVENRTRRTAHPPAFDGQRLSPIAGAGHRPDGELFAVQSRRWITAMLSRPPAERPTGGSVVHLSAATPAGRGPVHPMRPVGD